MRQSLYSLLEPQKKKGNVVNLLGFFSPLVDDCELYELLHQAGVKTVHEISRCRDYEEYQTMSQANFNLVLHPEARFAAEDFHDRLKIPFIELRRLYQMDKIENQYRALGQVLGVDFDQKKYKAEALEAVEQFQGRLSGCGFGVGECMNGDPFELGLALVSMVFKVPEIYGTITAENFVYIQNLAKLSPEHQSFFQYGAYHAVLRSGFKWREYYNRKGCRLLSSGSAKCSVEPGSSAIRLRRRAKAV